MASFYLWLSFIASSTTVLPKSHGYGGYQTTTSPPNYITTYATTSYYTDAHKYSSDPSYYTEAPANYTIEGHKYYTTKAPEYYTTTYAAPAYYTEAPKYYSAPAYYTEVLNTTLLPAKYPQLRRPIIMQYRLTTQWLLHRTTLIRITTPGFQFTTPKSTLSPSCYTEAPVYCNTKAPEYYTTTYASPTYYTEALKYYSAPSYNTTKASDYYITSQPMLLQPLCNLKLIFNENKCFNASNYLVRLLNTSKHFNIAMYSDLKKKRVDC
jgi:hypothetical protein